MFKASCYFFTERKKRDKERKKVSFCEVISKNCVKTEFG